MAPRSTTHVAATGQPLPDRHLALALLRCRRRRRAARARLHLRSPCATLLRSNALARRDTGLTRRRRSVIHLHERCAYARRRIHRLSDHHVRQFRRRRAHAAQSCAAPLAASDVALRILPRTPAQSSQFHVRDPKHNKRQRWAERNQRLASVQQPSLLLIARDHGHAVTQLRHERAVRHRRLHRSRPSRNGDFATH